MLLALREIIHRSGTDEKGFFDSAYWWKFQKTINVWGDVLQFKQHGKIPDYVVQYVQHLEGMKHGL